MLDIVDVKELCKKNIWNSYVKDGNIYLRNEIGEVVKIGGMKETKPSLSEQLKWLEEDYITGKGR